MIYHYTDTETFFKILHSEKLEMKASHYSIYGDNDYAWSKEQVEPFIEELCKEKSIEYDNELFFDPYVISFSKFLSEAMWRMKGHYHKGIAIEFHENIIHKFALRDINPYVFMECGYQKDIINWLRCSYEECYPCPTINDYQDDLMLISACYINQKYKDQKEYRFLEPYRCTEYFCYAPNCEDNCKFSNDEIDSTEHFIAFPKEALAGVIVGYHNSKEIVERMQRALKYKAFDLSKVNIRLEENNHATTRKRNAPTRRKI